MQRIAGRSEQEGETHLASGGHRGAQALADEGLGHDSGRHCS